MGQTCFSLTKLLSELTFKELPDVSLGFIIMLLALKSTGLNETSIFCFGSGSVTSGGRLICSYAVYTQGPDLCTGLKVCYVA